MKIGNENQVLLCCARKSMSESLMDRVKCLITQPLDWEGIVKAAFSENIAPLLYINLKDFGEAKLVPQKTLDSLKRFYFANLARNIELFSELCRILEAFNHREVDTMVLKGAALANIVYDDIALRYMVDIDILVRQEDLPYVKGIMTDLDYTVNAEVRSEEWYNKKHGFHLAPFKHIEKSIPVEVHWGISKKSFNIDITKWWTRKRKVEFDSYTAFIPSAEDMLVHLCLHLHHQNYNVRTIKRGLCDIYETLTYYKEFINWELFEHEISLCKIVKPIHSILYIIKEFFETGDDTLVKMNIDHVDLKFINILENKILNYSPFPGPFIGFYATDNGFVDKAKVLLDSVFPGREIMAARYSISITSKWVYFYYLIRPFALLLRYGKFLFCVFRIRKYSVED